MAPEKGYLIIDIGTGNVRVAITDEAGTVLQLERDTVRYTKDSLYPDAVYFDPGDLWKQIIALAQNAINKQPGISIGAITASSQREGIVLLDGSGNSLIGLSNHDHRGREWEDIIQDKHRVYSLTGRYPTSLFSSFKLVGLKNRRPEIYRQMAKMVSISDWAQFQLSGIAVYEHSQASETLLYDVKNKAWSIELSVLFGIDHSVLPPLQNSGSVLGTIKREYVELLKLSPDAVVVVGGADTQLAIKSTQPAINDIVIVSGTTTPIVKIVNEYVTDEQERTWTNRHIDAEQFILEANAGVTGLNYQRLKEIFYPNEGYDIIEKELEKERQFTCIAALGSLVAEEKSPLTKGGFIFNTPVSHELTRAGFVMAILRDIGCSIKENLETLCAVAGSTAGYVWACGGGFQSKFLRQLTANLTGKKILIREGYQQASVLGATLVCNEALGVNMKNELFFEEVLPQADNEELRSYQDWKAVRNSFRQRSLEEAI